MKLNSALLVIVLVFINCMVVAKESISDKEAVYACVTMH